MSEWPVRRLAEVAEVKHGYAFAGEYFSDHGVGPRLVTPGNFRIGGGWQNGKPKYYDGPAIPGYTLNKSDLVVTMTDLSKAGDTLGYSAFVPDGGPWLHNQRVGLVSVIRPDLVDVRYLGYVLRSIPYRQHVLATATGSTVRHTSPSRILEFATRWPSLPEQRAVAETLGAIEEN